MTTYHLPTGHKREEEQADCRFIRCENDQQTPDYVYPPELFIKTRNQFIQRIRNLNEARQLTERGDDV